MTRGFERPMVGATPIEEGMPQKNAREKLLITRNGPPPDVFLGPSLRTGRNMGSEYPDAAILIAPSFHPVWTT
jgi:hypothetical protein